MCHFGAGLQTVLYQVQPILYKLSITVVLGTKLFVTLRQCDEDLLYVIITLVQKKVSQ